MKISLDSVKQYLDFDLPPIDKLVDLIGLRLGALEEPPIKLSDIYKDALIVEVRECSKVADSDHLSSCFIDDGGKRPNIERNSQGLISVVCGAPNVKAGMLAVWLPPDSVVPVTYDKEPFVLESRSIRGQLSHGMLASAKELALSDDHQEIVAIEGAKPGDSFAKHYHLNDTIINIENKMFTHRPDCFGELGVAREISGILHQPFKSPRWYLAFARPKIESDLSININNEIPTKVRRFSLLLADNIKVQPSPSVVQSYLSKHGLRPVNNIVDLTNLVMLETGQPLHAYDYHKLKKLAGGEPTMTVRLPRADEDISLINGKKLKPPEQTIAIAIGEHLVGLGGIMGGSSSEVDANTTAIVIEAATFDMYAIRLASMELGLFSEAATRFTKGLSPLQTLRVLAYTASQLKILLPDVKIGKLIDDLHLPEADLKADSLSPPITVSAEFINNRLGSDLTSKQMASLLANVEIQVEVSGNNLVVKAPFWRTDLETSEDIVEEVGRLNGYENLKLSALVSKVKATPKNQQLENQATVRQLLASAGANELLTYSFIGQKLLDDVNQDSTKAYQLANSMSPELNYYRLSLTPSLLSKVQPNIKAGFNRFALFEIGNYHLKGLMNDKETNLPGEYSTAALVYAAKTAEAGAAYFKARAYLDFVLNELNAQGINYLPLKSIKIDDHLSEVIKPFNVERSAMVCLNNRQMGIVGEYLPELSHRLKLPDYCGGFEVSSELFSLARQDKAYRQISKYPALKQDLTLSVEASVSFFELFSYIAGELQKLAKESSYTFSPVSIFKPKDNRLNYTFHLEIASKLKTLKEPEVSAILDKLTSLAKDRFKAEKV